MLNAVLFSSEKCKCGNACTTHKCALHLRPVKNQVPAPKSSQTCVKIKHDSCHNHRGIPLRSDSLISWHFSKGDASFLWYTSV